MAAGSERAQRGVGARVRDVKRKLQHRELETKRLEHWVCSFINIHTNTLILIT
jgi:hypothetical protein